ncbi:MAG: hypothetical protein U0Q22_05005 [Acidimicrobiales bacterium]
MTPTIVEPRAGRRDGGFAAIIALLIVAIASPLFRDTPTDTPTRVAIGFLVLVTVGIVVNWVAVRRHPTVLVVGDDKIRLDPSAGDDEFDRIVRADGALRLHTIGSARARTVVLSSERGVARLSLRFLDRTEVADACHDHGWPFA